MRHSSPTDPRYRPHPVTTVEIERSEAAADALLTGPSDWMRRVVAARFDVALAPPAPSGASAETQSVLIQFGFKPLCSARIRQPTPGGRVEGCVEVWVDPTTRLRAEVFGPETVMLSAVFADGGSLLSMPDGTAAEWVEQPGCEVLTDADLGIRLESAMSRLAEHEIRGRRALLCANRDAYRSLLRVAALRHSKEPAHVRSEGRIVYPLTPTLAAQVSALRVAKPRLG